MGRRNVDVDSTGTGHGLYAGSGPARPQVLSTIGINARRLLLLVSLFSGLLAMHVFGAEDVNGNHAMPVMGVATATMDTAMLPAADTMSRLVVIDAGSHQSGHDGMAVCELFLVAGAVWSVFGWLLHKLARQVPALSLLSAARVTFSRWRAPPSGVRPRIALCVLRI